MVWDYNRSSSPCLYGKATGKSRKDGQYVGASAGAGNILSVAGMPEPKFWADVGGSAQDPKCTAGGDERADRGELADGGAKMMGAEVTDMEGDGLAPTDGGVQM